MTTITTGGAQAPFDPTAQSTSGKVSDGALGKDDFLNLLVAQLGNQDPLSPTDPTDFVSQLSQFTSLEQLIGVREGLDLLAVTQTAGTSAQMVSFIGKDVSFDDASMVLASDGATDTVSYDLGNDATEVTVGITNSDGDIVRTLKLGAHDRGDNTFTFDGLDDDGVPLPAGTYSLSLSAKDADGATVNSAVEGKGRVQGITFEAGYPQLVLEDGRKIGLGQILSVAAPKNADDIIPRVPLAPLRN